MSAINRVISRKNVQIGVLCMVLFATFLACYFPTFKWLNEKYLGQDSYYSHGYLIPFITLYMIIGKRAELRESTIISNPWGIFLIVFSLLVHIFGVLGDIHFISGFSMILYLAGCSLFLLGNDMTRKLAYPLSFLVFMCPIPDAFINVIALPMKSYATSLSIQILDVIGIPHIREGFRIHLATSTYVVGTPCNGMRSLISFLTLGFLFLYIVQARFWKKILFLGFIPPLAIVLNGLRITALLFIAKTYGQEMASPESILHDGSGLVLFIIGFLLLMLVSKMIHEESTD